jgi:hypothetical protein
MEALWIGLFFLAWYILALVVSEQMHGQSRIGKQWLFFAGFVGSPLLAYLLVKLFQRK